MNMKEVLCFLKAEEEQALFNGRRQRFNDTIEFVKELKKYKEMWEELENFRAYEAVEISEEYLSVEGGKMKYLMKLIKQQYTKKIITIEVDKVTQAIMDEINEKIKEYINGRFYFYEGHLGKIHIKEEAQCLKKANGTKQ